MFFLKQYLLHPREVGAVKPSSKWLARKMIRHVAFDRAKCIVEFGPGTGVFTDEILRAKKDETCFLIFEVNDSFYRNLSEKYRDAPNTYVLHDSARNMGSHLRMMGQGQADYVISGLPFASLPEEESDAVLRACRRHLSPRGLFITFQYTLLKVKLFQRYFNIASIEKELRNIPPAFVLNCRRKPKKKN